MSRMHKVPYHRISINSTVVIYGAGVVGNQYIADIKKTGYLKISGIIDKNKKGMISGILVQDLNLLSKEDFFYDYIIVAVSKVAIAEEIIEELHNQYKIPKNQIIWEDIWYYSQDGVLEYGSIMSEKKYLSMIIKSINKKKIVYGIGRGSLELLYMFPELNIQYFIRDDKVAPGDEATILGSNAYDKSIINKQMDKESFIIVTSFRNLDLENWLESLGYIIGRDWCYLDDFGMLLDFPSSINKKKICLITNGSDSDYEIFRFHEYYGSIEDVIINFDHFDSDDIEFKNYMVISIGNARKTTKNELKRIGVMNNIEYMEWSSVDILPSRVFAKTIYENPRSMPFCKRVENYLEISIQGNCFMESLCC